MAGARTVGGSPAARDVPPDPPPPAAAPAEPTEPGRLVLGLSYAGVVLVSFTVALYASFLSPAGPRVGGVLLSYGVLIALVGPGAAALLGHQSTGTRLGALVPLFVWIVMTVLVLGQKRTEGDLILTGGGRDYLLIVAGILSSTTVAALARPWRGLTALPGAEPRR